MLEIFELSILILFTEMIQCDEHLHGDIFEIDKSFFDILPRSTTIYSFASTIAVIVLFTRIQIFELMYSPSKYNFFDTLELMVSNSERILLETVKFLFEIFFATGNNSDMNQDGNIGRRNSV